MSNKSSFVKFSFKTTADASALLPFRPARSNKGSFGRVLCVCGSHGMAGAAYLCAKAAYRTGAGLVEIFTHESNRIPLQTLLPEAIVTSYEEYSPHLLLSAVERADCVAAGCGLGVTSTSRAILSDLLRAVDTEKTPLVVDADGLNLISRNPSLKKYLRGAVVTPHPAEMSRLTGKSVEEILEDIPNTAYSFAASRGAVCVLKDHCTAVSDGGQRVYVNTTGNSGMATGGSGDVLTGIVAGLLAQKRSVGERLLEDVALAVYLHGLCGDIAAGELSEYSVMASDLTDAIPRAISKLLQKTK